MLGPTLVRDRAAALCERLVEQSAVPDRGRCRRADALGVPVVRTGPGDQVVLEDEDLREIHLDLLASCAGSRGEAHFLDDAVAVGGELVGVRRVAPPFPGAPGRL